MSGSKIRVTQKKPGRRSGGSGGNGTQAQSAMGAAILRKSRGDRAGDGPNKEFHDPSHSQAAAAGSHHVAAFGVSGSEDRSLADPANGPTPAPGLPAAPGPALHSNNFATKDGIQVYCAYKAMTAPGELQLHPKNPNKHPKEQLRLYLKIIRANGWRRPVVVSKRSLLVTKGNGAVMAARLGKLAQIPIDFQDYENEEAELEDLIADNELARLAKANEQELEQLLAGLQEKGRDPELAGILQRLEKEGDAAPKIDLNNVFQILIECPGEQEQKTIYERLTKKGLKCRVLTF